MVALGRCSKLESLEVGLSHEKIDKMPADLTPSVKQFLLKKSCKLKIFKVYECDGPMLTFLSQGPETQSLEELSIVKFA